MTRVIASSAAALVLLTLAVAVGWTPLLSLDGWLSAHAFAATHGHPGRTSAWTAVTDWAAPEPLRHALLVAAVVALALRRVGVATWLVALSVLEGVVAPAAKDLLQRPRPDWADPITVLASTSYPSGHATAAATVGVALALVVRRRVARAAAVLLAASVAASRVFLGAHYPSDVVAGLLLGTLLATSTYALLLLVGTRRARPPASLAAPQAEVSGRR